MSRLYEVCRWASRLAAVNLLWLAGAIAGLGVVGAFPATAAMFGVIREWMVNSDEPAPLGRTFWRRYRAELVPANRLGYILALIGYVLFVDLHFFHGPVYSISLGLCLIFVVALIYVFPIYAHLDLPWHEQLRLALMAGISNPLRTLLALATGVSLYFVFSRVPGLAIFFGGSLWSAFTIWQTLHIIELRERRRAIDPAPNYNR